MSSNVCISPDRRVERSRAALRQAFSQLIIERGFDELTAADVAELANVGRSTFYAHYANLGELLSEVISPILAPLADAAVEQAPALQHMVEHVWENRMMSRNLFNGPMRTRLIHLLAAQVAARLLKANNGVQAQKPDPALTLAALQIAAGQMGVLESWLGGRTAGSAALISRQIHLGSAAVASVWWREASCP